jgi:6,7-dimethyl-8-ribityllumazine synthase
MLECLRMHRPQDTVAPVDASHLRVGIAVADFNADITHALLEGARTTLAAWKVKEENITVFHVPGSFEVPFAVQKLLRAPIKPHAVVALGCIIKGETDHDKYLAASVTDALLRLSLDFETPVASGVITANTLLQAQARAEGAMNRGSEATVAALTAALL